MREFFGKHWKLGWILALILLIGLVVTVVLLTSGRGKPAPAVTGVDETLVAEVTGAAVNATEAAAQTAESAATEASATAEGAPGELAAGATRVSEIDGMEQVFVPAGEFLMGTNDLEAKRTEEGGRAYPEIPQFTYYLDSFWIDKYEVTNAQYRLCVQAGVCTEPHRIGSYTYPDYFTNPVYDNYPVVWVSWFQSVDYCEWAGRRLPTEAEWEKAARGTDGRKYTWGNDPVTEDKANFCDVNCTRTHAMEDYNDGYPDTSPVGTYPAGVSPYGAYDMAGNVWEWTSTLPFPYPYDANDGREDQTALGERVWRGGPWSNGLWWMRASLRYRALDIYSWYVLGIRCAANP